MPVLLEISNDTRQGKWKISSRSSQLYMQITHFKNPTLKLTLLMSLIALSVLSVKAQTNTAIDIYMAEVRAGTYKPVPSTVWENPKSYKETLESLKPYYSDTLALVRSKAYNIAKRLALNSDAKKLRKQVVGQLIDAIADKDSGISGYASSSLRDFSEQDFSEGQKFKLMSYLNKPIPHKRSVILLIGVLQLYGAIEPLRTLSGQGNGKYIRWAASLALARMEDAEALLFVVNTVKNRPVNDDLIYDLVPDLIYTRQKLAFDYLFKIINSDEENCFPADPDAVQKIMCAYRVLEYIAPYIENFPLQVEEEQLLVDDYQQALMDVRNWFRDNNTSYIIKKDTF